MYKFVNPNPRGNLTGDCTVRAIAIALEITWEEAYWLLAEYGFMFGEMQNANSVVSAVLKDNGFTRHIIPDTCPACYTVRDFCLDHPKGTYVLGTGSHVVAVIDGTEMDTWRSLNEVPIMYWRKEYGIL